jgi:hypothetical protein
MSADSTLLAPASTATVSGPATEDLFTLGRRAAAARDAALGRRGTFTRTRRLLPTGAWRGPRDATLSYVETLDLPALGGWSAARTAGADALIGADMNALRAAAADGARVLCRAPFRIGEREPERLDRLSVLAAELAAGLPLWGVLPTPEGEPYGLDTIRFTALCRLALPGVAHVVADVDALGLRLAQMCFGFGADDLLALVVAERALRLGDNAHDTALTRKEAITLIRGAGLVAAERLANDVLEDAS